MAKAKELVIVESPSKAKTIEKYLGSDYKVRASMGHLRDLPKNRLGVDLENGFQPEYIPVKEKKKSVTLSELAEIDPELLTGKPAETVKAPKLPSLPDGKNIKKATFCLQILPKSLAVRLKMCNFVAHFKVKRLKD